MKNGRKTAMRNIFALLTVSLMLSACVTGNNNTSTLPSDEGSLADLPPMSSTVGNYEDIEMPSEMKYVTKDSLSIRTDSFRGGIINYKGRIDAYSLKDFIISSMKKNKWKLAGEVSSQDIILAFTKPHRTCMMSIKPNSSLSDTTLSMYVTVDLAASKTLNAFGEPIQ